MRRADRAVLAALFLVLLAGAGFVGLQLWHAPRRAPRTAPVASLEDSAADPDGGASGRVRGSSLPAPPPRDYAEIARILADASGSTYIDAILAARDGNVARWPERRGNPVTVWVQPTTTIRDFWPDFRDRARDAFYTWAASGVPLRFLFVDDSSEAEVHVVWVDRFDDSAAGKTFWERDPNWWIVGGEIEIALHRPNGEPYDAQMIRAITMHEVGHLIGLDHSPSRDDIMSPQVHVTSLSPADLRTAALIYRLPPGPVTRPPAP